MLFTRQRFGASALLLAFVIPAELAGLPAVELSREAAWLRHYLRFESSQPDGASGDGGERAAIDWLASLLAAESIRAEVLVSPGGRASLIARLPAPDPEAPAIVLLHHVDVVPAGADPKLWQHPPFGGEVAEGALWGRGAIDTKSLGIAHLAAFLELARQPDRRRDLVFLATADEETGGAEGVGWILGARPELFVRTEAVLGEGGTGKSVAGRPLWWGIEIEQKRPLWLEVTARGKAGHGSSAGPESAAHRLIAGLARLLEAPPPLAGSRSGLNFLEALGRFDQRAARAARQVVLLLNGTPLDPVDARALAGYENLLRDSLQVTTLAAADRINIVPGEARAEIDLRLLPETDEGRLLTEIKRRLGDGLEVRVRLSSPAVAASPTTSDVYRALAARLAREAPVVPAFLPAFTDSRHFRARGIAAYGVTPFALEATELLTVHAPNERISLAAFDRGVARMKELVAALVVRPKLP